MQITASVLIVSIHLIILERLVTCLYSVICNFFLYPGLSCVFTWEIQPKFTAANRESTTNSKCLLSIVNIFCSTFSVFRALSVCRIFGSNCSSKYAALRYKSNKKQNWWMFIIISPVICWKKYTYNCGIWLSKDMRIFFFFKLKCVPKSFIQSQNLILVHISIRRKSNSPIYLSAFKILSSKHNKKLKINLIRTESLFLTNY